jgi:DNA-binding NtrC family response regulator
VAGGFPICSPKANGHDGRLGVSVVLIVDDESGIRELLARWLTGAGYETRGAADAEAALLEMARAPADVVLCDIEMPGRGGVWLTGQLRERFPEVAMVLATAVDSVPPSTSFKPGVVDYVLKPFSRERVLNAVAAAVKWHAAAVAKGPQSSEAANRLSTWLGTDDADK